MKTDWSLCLCLCRIAVFSVTVLRDERIVVVAEQRPDSTEEDSFQWMSRVLQVGCLTHCGHVRLSLLLLNLSSCFVCCFSINENSRTQLVLGKDEHSAVCSLLDWHITVSYIIPDCIMCLNVIVQLLWKNHSFKMPVTSENNSSSEHNPPLPLSALSVL